MNMVSSIDIDDLNEAVRSTALLADVTISVWGGERSDERITNSIREDQHATGDVGRFVKKMLAGADGALKETKSAFNAVRLKHYGLTLPWVSDPHATRMTGARLLPNALFDRYAKEMGLAKRQALASLDKFIAEYPDLVVRAKANLGGMADATYPTPEEVRGKFRVSFDFEPIPAGQNFRGLPDHMITKLSQGLAAKQHRMIATAQAAMWAEVRERVAKIMERLSPSATGEEQRFKLSTIENARDLITLLPGWNVTGDPQVDEIVADIHTMLDGVDADKLRNDSTARAFTAHQAQQVIEKMSRWGL
jgi:hypothetical protein